MAKSPKNPPIEVGERELQLTALKAKYKNLFDAPKIEPVSPDDVLPTPSAHVNNITGVDRGIRKGSVVVWYGPQGSLKTTVALEMIREAQAKYPDKPVAYIDAEYRVDLSTAIKQFNINVEPFDTGVPRFVYRRTNVSEDAYQFIYDLLQTKQFSLIVLDSVTVLRPRKSVEAGEMKIGPVGSAARISSEVLPYISVAAEDAGTTLWIVSQERTTAIEPIVEVSFTGGAAVGFYATHIFRSRRIPKTWEEEDRDLTIWLEKSKYSLNMRKVTVPVILGIGIDREGDLLDYGRELGVIGKSGSWYSFEGVNIANGRSASGASLRSNPDLYQKIRLAISAAESEADGEAA